MFRIPKNRSTADKHRDPRPSLGPLETSLMEILWSAGESSVREVLERLNKPLAYTTVMTTLERLFRKLMLSRRKVGRAFLYSPRLSRQDWQRERVGELIAAFLDGTKPSHDLLLSSLVDAVGQHDQAALDVLEMKIQARREELARRGGQ